MPKVTGTRAARVRRAEVAARSSGRRQRRRRGAARAARRDRRTASRRCRVGDCNDLNVLVEGRAVHLIDVDSYQFAGYRVLDVQRALRRSAAVRSAARMPIRPHDTRQRLVRVRRDGAALAARRRAVGWRPSTGGGVQRCRGTRPVRRLSVLGTDIVYPRAARPLAILPDELARRVSRRSSSATCAACFRAHELERLRLNPCATCGDEHARVRCPSCQTRAHVPPTSIQGRLRWQLLARRPELATQVVRSTGAVWLAGDALMRSTKLGPERIGSVLAGQTRAWVGAKLGVGFYRAGGFAVGFVFRPDRGMLDDRVVLPKLRGELVDAYAIIGDDRAWLFLTLAEAGKLDHDVRRDRERRHACSPPSRCHDQPWLAGAAGACAAGAHLFVPTDDGIARIDVVQGAIVHARTFPETAPLVGAGDSLVARSRRHRRRAPSRCGAPPTLVKGPMTKTAPDPDSLRPQARRRVGLPSRCRDARDQRRRVARRNTRSSHRPPTRRASTCC